MQVRIREIKCKTALSPSLLPGYDYALNPYRGCEHACIYCYSPSVLRCREKWGTFVEPKVNIARVLSRELRDKPKGVVGISSVTDPYQPLERKYELTRRCLELLLKYNFPISIQTKSALVMRDLDLIKQFSNKDVGLTITTIEDELRRKYEPIASSVKERLLALRKIAECGITSWVFIGPIMPFISDRNGSLEELLRAIADSGVSYILIDKLRMKPGIWDNIEKFLVDYDATLIPSYKEILFKRDDSYFINVRRRVMELCKQLGLKCESCF
ncbi:MAG: radical SAM protein [Methanocellales archaeon]